jgi:hypothetical protein
MNEATAPNVNYEAMAVTALSRVQKFEQVLAAVPEQARLCREAWRDFGQALNELRTQHASDKRFGQAVKRLGLDAPPANSHAIRSDAMWFASVWSTVTRGTVDLGSSHNPHSIRKLCRERGYSWASDAKDTTPKPVRGPTISERLEAAHLIKITWDSEKRRRVIDELAIESGLDALPRRCKLTPEQAARVDVGIVRLQVKYGAADVADVIAREREAAALSVSMRVRYDKAVERISQALRVEYQKQFDAAVIAECERRLPDDIKEARERAHESQQRSDRAFDDWIRRRDAIPKAMTREQWRLVLNCLHPDRAPEDRRERYAEAFATVKRLESCLRD